MVIDPSALTRPQLGALISGLVYPRPIAWVSTLAPDGTRNLAPFSFFNAFSFHPYPTIGLGPGARRGVPKDTLANIEATGEFVVNLVSRALAETVNHTSAEAPADVDEWQLAGVQGQACEVVAPERVAGAPAAFEYRLSNILPLGSDEMPSNCLVVGRVVRLHVDASAMDGATPRPEALDLVGRMGADEWCTTRDRFTLPRPIANERVTATAATRPSIVNRRGDQP
jgi:flavin reductase (DIM6/NTAB) family NADH-FMN oxidoreductase RutF